MYIYPGDRTRTRLDGYTASSTLKFQRCPSCHIVGVDVNRASKGVTNATIVTKATMVL
jgi:hypothetical protein